MLTRITRSGIAVFSLPKALLQYASIVQHVGFACFNAVAVLLQMRTVHQCIVLLLVSAIAVSAQPFQPGQNLAPLGKYTHIDVELRSAVCALSAFAWYSRCIHAHLLENFYLQWTC